MDKSLGTILHLWSFFTRDKQIHLHLFSPPSPLPILPTDRQTDRHVYLESYLPTDRQTDMFTWSLTYQQTDRQTDRHVYLESYTMNSISTKLSLLMKPFFDCQCWIRVHEATHFKTDNTPF